MLPLREGKRKWFLSREGERKMLSSRKEGRFLSRNPVKGGEEKRGWGGAGDKGVLKGTRFTGLSS